MPLLLVEDNVDEKLFDPGLITQLHADVSAFFSGCDVPGQSCELRSNRKKLFPRFSFVELRIEKRSRHAVRGGDLHTANDRSSGLFENIIRLFERNSRADSSVGDIG